MRPSVDEIPRQRCVSESLGSFSPSLPPRFRRLSGFSNYVSPLGSIQDFAILSGGGNRRHLRRFRRACPSCQTRTRTGFDRRGRDRHTPAVGVGSGLLNRVLGTATLAQRAPLVVIVLRYSSPPQGRTARQVSIPSSTKPISSRRMRRRGRSLSRNRSHPVSTR